MRSPDDLISGAEKVEKRKFQDGYTYDEALNELGFGKYQKMLFVLTGAVWAADAMEIMLLTFLIPQLEDHWDLSKVQAGSLGAVVFGGMLIGAWFWAYMSDNYGRRPVLLISLAMIAFFGLLSSFSVNMYMLLVMRFFVGFAAGGSSASFTLFAEFCPTHDRGQALLWEQGFWTLGAIFAVVAAWIFIPCCGWRYFVGFSSVPLWIILCFWKYVPESPRFLLMVGRTSEAQKICEEMAKYNGKELPGQNLINEYIGSQQRGNTKHLWLPAYRKTTNLLMISFVSCVFTYYGLAFVAEYIFEGSDLYWQMLITTSSEFPGLIIGYFVLDWIGRIRSMSLFFSIFVVAGYLLVIPYCFDNKTIAVILVYIARMAISTSFYTIYIYFTEYYPTVIRNTALGTASALGRIAGMVTSYTVALLDPRLAMGILATAGGVALLANMHLPTETLNREMDDRLAIEMDETEILRSVLADPRGKGAFEETNLGEIERSPASAKFPAMPDEGPGAELGVQ